MEVSWHKVREMDAILCVFRVAGEHGRPKQGWLRAMRQALGLSGEELGKRMGRARQEVYKMEKREVAGVIELRTLRAAAEALGCELVYAFVPKEGSLEGMLARREHQEQEERREWLRLCRTSPEHRRQVRERLLGMIKQMGLETRQAGQ